jgi:hypothetical protein
MKSTDLDNGSVCWRQIVWNPWLNYFPPEWLPSITQTTHLRITGHGHQLCSLAHLGSSLFENTSANVFSLFIVLFEKYGNNFIIRFWLCVSTSQHMAISYVSCIILVREHTQVGNVSRRCFRFTLFPSKNKHWKKTTKAFPFWSGPRNRSVIHHRLHLHIANRSDLGPYEVTYSRSHFMPGKSSNRQNSSIEI